MMKISFNHFVIKLRLHKLIPNITYKKSDFYFLSGEAGCGSNIPYISVDNREENLDKNTKYNGEKDNDKSNVNSGDKKTDYFSEK